MFCLQRCVVFLAKASFKLLLEIFRGTRVGPVTSSLWFNANLPLAFANLRHRWKLAHELETKRGHLHPNSFSVFFFSLHYCLACTNSQDMRECLTLLGTQPWHCLASAKPSELGELGSQKERRVLRDLGVTWAREATRTSNTSTCQSAPSWLFLSHWKLSVSTKL